MTRSLSADLRGRVIAAIEDGISTAGAWHRRYRESGEIEARKQGQPSCSKLDPHKAFILTLIEAAPDITLAEIGERLAVERGGLQPPRLSASGRALLAWQPDRLIQRLIGQADQAAAL